MLTMDEILRLYGTPREPAAVVRLARSLHRLGVKRRNTGLVYFVIAGARNRRDARDLVTFARALKEKN